MYNQAQWIKPLKDQLSLLRPHMTLCMLNTIGLMAWHEHGTKNEDPQKVARERSTAMDAGPTQRIRFGLQVRRSRPSAIGHELPFTSGCFRRMNCEGVLAPSPRSAIHARRRYVLCAGRAYRRRHVLTTLVSHTNE
jgi:hypothetical protein